MKTKPGKKLVSVLSLLIFGTSLYAASCLDTFNYDVGMATLQHAGNATACDAAPGFLYYMCHYENDLEYQQNFNNAVNSYNICCGTGC